MEAGWERGVERQEFSLDRLNDLLARHELRLHSAEPIPEGKANTSLRVVTSTGQTLLFRSHQREPSVGRLENQIARLLTDETFVPRVVLYDPEEAFSLVEWVRGQSLESLLAGGRHAEVCQAAESIGEGLGRISSYRFPAAGFFGDDLKVAHPWPSAGRGIGDYLVHLLSQPRVRERLPPSELTRLVPMAEGLADEINGAAPHPVLSHGDFKASNLLIHEGRLSGVVDWEFAHSGTTVLSLGQLFRHPLPGEFQTKFELGYVRAGGTLPEGWRKLAKRTDLVNLLEFLNRDRLNPKMEADLLSLVGSTD